MIPEKWMTMCSLNPGIVKAKVVGSMGGYSCGFQMAKARELLYLSISWTGAECIKHTHNIYKGYFINLKPQISIQSGIETSESLLMNPNLSSGARCHLKSASGFQFPFLWMFWLYMCVSRLVVSDSCHPKDCSSPDSSVHGILQSRILEVLISFPRDLLNLESNPGFSHCMQIFYRLSPQGSHSVVQYQENADWHVICYYYSLTSICLKGQCMPTISFISDTFIRSSSILRNGRRNWTLRSTLVQGNVRVTLLISSLFNN